MKKQLLYGLICVGLMMSSMASAAMSPRRIWQCFSKPKDNKCTTGEIVAADAAMAAGGVLLTAGLAALGIGAAQIKKASDERKKLAGEIQIPYEEPVETPEAKRTRELNDINSQIFTLKRDIEDYEKQLIILQREQETIKGTAALQKNATAQARINQMIKGHQNQIAAHEGTKKLMDSSTYKWR